MTSSTMDLIQQHLGDEGITELTQHLGVDPNTAKAAAAAALPALINAMSGQSSQPGAAPGASGIGAGGLAGLAGGILGNIFGGNHSTVSQQVSHKTGLSLQDAEKALLFLAPIVLAKLQQQGGSTTPATPSAQQTQPQGTEPTQPQADGDSGGLGGVIGAVEKIFRR
jgi:hypothetical protein